jgi:hypothetical protein
MKICRYCRGSYCEGVLGYLGHNFGGLSVSSESRKTEKAMRRVMASQIPKSELRIVRCGIAAGKSPRSAVSYDLRKSKWTGRRSSFVVTIEECGGNATSSYTGDSGEFFQKANISC